MADIAALYLHSPFDGALSFLPFTSNPTVVQNRKINVFQSPKVQKQKQNLHHWLPL